METNQNILQQDQENAHYFICTSLQCEFRGFILSSSIQSIHQNCNVLPYKEFVDSIKNYHDQFFLSETFQNYDLKLKCYLKKIYKLQQELNGKSLMFKNIKRNLNKANVQKNKLKQLLQQFQDNFTQSNFDLLEQLYQSSRQQHTIDNIQSNFKKIDDELKKNLYIQSINQVEIQEDDESSDDESSDEDSSDDDDQNKRILNQQLDPEAQELENKYNQAFNFLRNNAVNQVQQNNNNEQQSQLQQQNQSQQNEEQTNIKFIEKLGNNLIIVATESQLRIYDLKSKSFQQKIIYINAKITSLQVTKFEQVIVVGKKDGDIEVLEWDSKQNNTFKIFKVSNEEGRLFVEKLQPSHIACLGRDGNCKIYETPNFNFINSYKLDQGAKVVPTCLFAISEQQFIIGAEKTLFFNNKKIEYLFNGKIKQICQFGNRWLVADKTAIYILVQNGEFISLLKEFAFSPKQIIYMTTFYESQYIFINTKSAKSDYQNQVATILISGEQMELQLQQLDKNIQVKLLKGYQSNNETLLYGINGFNITEYKMIRDNDKFIVL